MASQQLICAEKPHGRACRFQPGVWLRLREQEQVRDAALDLELGLVVGWR
jgi:hypothetical protein